MSDFTLNVKKEFLALGQKVHGKDLVYLDSAASTLKPRVVVDRITKYYNFEASNVHRGAHYLSQKGTESYEAARETVTRFLNASSPEEIIFTRGTTESVNLVATSYAEAFLNEGDEILLTEMEHHSNIVPWQRVAEKKKLTLKYVKILDSGDIDREDFQTKLNENTQLVSFLSCSNVFGSIQDVKALTRLAQKRGAKVFIDGAQSVSHSPVDVREIGCDFFAFSGHKVFGPYGIGVLWGKKEILNSMPPYQGGGSMISEVQLKGSTYLESPQRFEAGTPHIAGAIGLAVALQFVEDLGFSEIKKHDLQIQKACEELLYSIEGLKIYGHPKEKTCIVPFNFEGIHSSDIGSIIDNEGVAIRTGHHCCQPLMSRLGVTGTGRASFSIYNTLEDVERLARALVKAKGFFL